MKEETNAMKSQEVNFQNSQKLFASRAGSSKQTIARTAYSVYVTRHWNLMNSYWMFWIGHVRGARSVSSFCDFRKMTFRDLTKFSPFWCEKILCFSDILLKEY